MRTPEEILNLILNVAKEDDHIRAVYMVGSRANKDCPVDIYQDFDITFLVDMVTLRAMLPMSTRGLSPR